MGYDRVEPIPMTLAIVDDDDDVRTALTRLLCSLGHDVKTYASAEEFEAATVTVDCLIADVRLPGISGLDLRERLRNRATPTPVVLITGDSDRIADDIPQAADTASVTKPFDDVELLAAIANAIAFGNARSQSHAH